MKSQTSDSQRGAAERPADRWTDVPVEIVNRLSWNGALTGAVAVEDTADLRQRSILKDALAGAIAVIDTTGFGLFVSLRELSQAPVIRI